MASLADSSLLLAEQRARSRHGVLTHAEATRAGVGEKLRSRTIASGRWRRLFPRVYAISGAYDGWKQQLAAAVLWGGARAAASHRTAARLHGLEGLPRTAWPFDVMLPRASHPRAQYQLALHSSRDLRSDDVTTVEGIPCTGMVRTLVDLAACFGELELAMAVESAWRKDPLLLDRLSERLDGIDERGRSGIRALRGILADCSARAHKPMDSPLEVRLWRWVLTKDLPPPIPQYPYEGHGPYVRFIDFAYPEQKLAIETDGFDFHRDRESFERDAAKLSFLASRGWRVIHATSRQLDSDARTLERRIAEGLGVSSRA